MLPEDAILLPEIVDEISLDRARDGGPRQLVACVRGAVGHLDRAAVSTSSSKASCVPIQASEARANPALQPLCHGLPALGTTIDALVTLQVML